MFAKDIIFFIVAKIKNTEIKKHINMIHIPILIPFKNRIIPIRQDNNTSIKLLILNPILLSDFIFLCGLSQGASISVIDIDKITNGIKRIVKWSSIISL